MAVDMIQREEDLKDRWRRLYEEGGWEKLWEEYIKMFPIAKITSDIHISDFLEEEDKPQGEKKTMRVRVEQEIELTFPFYIELPLGYGGRVVTKYIESTQFLSAQEDDSGFLIRKEYINHEEFEHHIKNQFNAGAVLVSEQYFNQFYEHVAKNLGR